MPSIISVSNITKLEHFGVALLFGAATLAIEYVTTKTVNYEAVLTTAEIGYGVSLSLVPIITDLENIYNTATKTTGVPVASAQKTVVGATMPLVVSTSNNAITNTSTVTYQLDGHTITVKTLQPIGTQYGSLKVGYPITESGTYNGTKVPAGAVFLGVYQDNIYTFELNGNYYN